MIAIGASGMITCELNKKNKKTKEKPFRNTGVVLVTSESF